MPRRPPTPITLRVLVSRGGPCIMVAGLHFNNLPKSKLRPCCHRRFGGETVPEEGEVALFIDFENIRYGLKNNHRQEPDPKKLMEKALKYGRVRVAQAYADFREHPEEVRSRLDVAGIQARDIPLRRFINQGVERVKSTADLHMVMDIIETVLDRPQVETFVLMTGDRDFIRPVTWLRNRFGKRVIVVGVPGTISDDLISAASEADPVEVEEVSADVVADLKLELIRMVERMRPPHGFLTYTLIRKWALDRRSGLAATEKEIATALSELITDAVLLQDVRYIEGREVRVSFLDREHELVVQALS